MTRVQRIWWLLVVVVTAVAAGLLVPGLPAMAPATRDLSADTTVSLRTAAVTFPAGWDLDIAASSQSQPAASVGGVTVATTDALWFGASERLVSNVADLAFSAPPTLPQVPADAKGAEREAWVIAPDRAAPEGDPERVVVVRQGQGVVLVIVRGPAAEVAAQRDAIDAIVASVVLDSVSLDVDVAS